jgi:hypothetical protein
LGIVLALGLAACKTQDPCAPAGTACGGDPTGVWTVVSGCREPIYQPPVPTTYLGQPSTPARQPGPEPSSSDWCDYLTNDPVQGLSFQSLPYDTLFFSTGTVTYDPNGTYTVILSTPGYGHIDLSATCLQRLGAIPSCDQLTTQMAAQAAKLGTYHDMACQSDDNNGCYCSYRVLFDKSGQANGHWNTFGTVLNHYPQSLELPSQADYCVDPSGTTMTLWGHDQTDIWNTAGLRTINLQRM